MNSCCCCSFTNTFTLLWMSHLPLTDSISMSLWTLWTLLSWLWKESGCRYQIEEDDCFKIFFYKLAEKPFKPVLTELSLVPQSVCPPAVMKLQQLILLPGRRPLGLTASLGVRRKLSTLSAYQQVDVLDKHTWLAKAVWKSTAATSQQWKKTSILAQLVRFALHMIPTVNRMRF